MKALFKGMRIGVLGSSCVLASLVLIAPALNVRSKLEVNDFGPIVSRLLVFSSGIAAVSTFIYYLGEEVQK